MENKLRQIIREELQKMNLNEAVNLQLGDELNTRLILTNDDSITDAEDSVWMLKNRTGTLKFHAADIDLFIGALNRMYKSYK